ncbi:MAG: hypothetical protein EOP48_04960 [Sphingobacteriales bacterium]|nr:MAG: hypothetical protein EOP48_04960 [Sphingobacteriales bacterium]
MKICLTIVFLLIQFVTSGQEYWQQQVDMNIHVSLDETQHSLKGDVSMLYQNNSPDTLSFIWIHLWPNAYKNDRTAFNEQLLQQGRTDFYFSKETDKGYINQLAFSVNGQTAQTVDHPEHQDIIQLLLPSPLLPGKSINIKTPFHIKLPAIFSRSGHLDQFYQVTQWYPKPAVYDRKGWHPMPYLDQGEFYSEFGTFDVEIIVPEKYTVAASGNLIREQVLDTFKVHTYHQENIHDFAWFASKDLEKESMITTVDGKPLTLAVYYKRGQKQFWENSLNVMKQAIEWRNQWIGPYPYSVVSVVASRDLSGGMEYPTITLISNFENRTIRDRIIHHELGHNWFHGIIATNERQHPWMDEGMNSFYDRRTDSVLTENRHTKKNIFARQFSESTTQSGMLASLYNMKADQPVETPSAQFSSLNYGMIAYEKTSQWMQLLETTMGTEKFDVLMKRYYSEWKFKHPYPEDFKTLAESVNGESLDQIFDLLNRKGSLRQPAKTKIEIKPLLSVSAEENVHTISVAPAVGYNKYDKFQVGALIHNYNLPLPNLRFVAAPLYATGSKSFNGIGRVEYSYYPNNGSHFKFFVTASKFNMGAFTDEKQGTGYLSFFKLAPGIEYELPRTSPLSTLRKYVRFKHFKIKETQLRFERDTLTNTFTPLYPKQSRYLNQLQIGLENNRSLYPYSVALLAEHGNGFAKTSLTSKYFYNYAGGGGMQVRAFAGKFFYTGEKTNIARFALERYHFNMTGSNGYEDYTYSDYFIGRNEFEGFASQQIMNRDGAFKVRTDLLSSKVGRSDDWLAALNFSSTIPKAINPLSVLPFTLPIKLFADIGTHAEAWDKENTSGKFLYDAGIQLSFFNVLNLYYPILYSKVYDDYYKSVITENKFKSKISFTIDLQNIPLRKYFPQVPF